MSIKNICDACGTDKFEIYLSGKDNFRDELELPQKYKGNRDKLLRPLHLDDLKEYIRKYHNCEIVERIEADDACCIDVGNAYKKWLQTKSDKVHVV